MAGRLGAAPSKLSFGDSVAQAGARPIGNWCGPSAGQSRRPQAPKVKGPEAFALPAHAISIKNKHLLAIYSIPARGFTAAVSVFRGTPPPKPLICKFVLSDPDDAIDRPWAHHVGDEPRLVLADFSFASGDIIEMSRFYRSQTAVHSLTAIHFRCSTSKQKTLLTRGKQGGEILFRFFTCLPPDYPSSFRGLARNTTKWIAQG